MAVATDTAARFRAAVLAHDADEIAALCAPDVVVHGPVTRRMAFHGRDEVRELFAVVMANVDGIRYVEDVGDEALRVLTLEGRRGRHRYEEAVLMRIDDRGAITELRIFVRPLPGTVAMAAAFAPALARARGLRVRAVLLTLLLAPVRAMLLHGDALGVRLLRRRDHAHHQVPDPLVVRAVEPAATRVLRQAVLRPHQTVDDLAGHEPAGTYAVGAFDGDDALVAVGLVGPDDDGWRVRGMATAPEHRGNGAGGAVLRALLDHATAMGATRVWCTARIEARTLYERAGFAVASEEFELPQIGPHVVMELRLTGDGVPDA